MLFSYGGTSALSVCPPHRSARLTVLICPSLADRLQQSNWSQVSTIVAAVLGGGENYLSSIGAVCGKRTKSYGSRNVTAPPAPVGDVGTESNAATNHPQQEFASAAQLAALQAQVTALTALLQDRNAAVSHLPQVLTPLLFADIWPKSILGQPSWMPTPTLVETPVLSLEQRLEEMMGRKIAEAMSNKSSRQQSMVLEEDPFSLEVMAVPLPRDFEQPKMEKYDGSSDPVDHLRSFVDLMRLQSTPDAIMCRTFPPTLRWEARDWLATLPPKSIRTFDEFSKNFATHFTSSKCVKKITISLMQLVHGKDELLKDFIVRFNRATLDKISE
ncbi:Uncharacterized protein Adt_26608 [Abeliophyllum distichum]|uniref:Retrotransposon gag domain-containing protein n=1 Tax=Abeliophyllum distichum TaxID=126358 RepID=A0ABD1RRE1_9LAMI